MDINKQKFHKQSKYLTNLLSGLNPLQYEAGPINASISARDGADSTYSHVNGTIYTF